MRRGVCLLVLCVAAPAVGVASARAGGTATTTTGTTTTGTTTSATTTAPTYAPLSPSSLPAGCVGAGAAALVLPSHPVIALGSPATNLGPSAYPSSGSVLAFDSSTASGSICKSAAVTLTSISLFGGAVTASSVQATHGTGSVAGLEIDGAPVTAVAGETVPVDGWGQLTLDGTVGRVTAPLVLRLLQAHDSLAAGTAVAVGFAASAQLIAKPHAPQRPPTPRPGAHSSGTHRAGEHRPRQQKPPPDYPASASPFAPGGGFTDAATDNPVVATALQYLGVPYQWGGASPKTGFDCSGLVQYVFARLGVSLIHYAAAQWHSPGGVWVAPNRLQPGDLVFFTGSDGTRKEPGHVGIYIEDGYIIDAPHTGAFVRIDRLDSRALANQYVGARRILGVRSDARHLFRAAAASPWARGIPVGFTSPLTAGPLGASLGAAAAGPAAVATASPWRWVGAGLGGLLLLLGAGSVLVRPGRTCRKTTNA